MTMLSVRNADGTPKIPAGWRLLSEEEQTIRGDMWASTPGGGDWRDDGYSVGVYAGYYGNTIIFIRRSAPQAQDKEWLNPWD